VFFFVSFLQGVLVPMLVVLVFDFCCYYVSLSVCHVTSVRPNSDVSELSSSPHAARSEPNSLTPSLLGWLLVRQYERSGRWGLVHGDLGVGIIGGYVVFLPREVVLTLQ
jgi:hypothetical protein